MKREFGIIRKVDVEDYEGIKGGMLWRNTELEYKAECMKREFVESTYIHS